MWIVGLALLFHVALHVHGHYEPRRVDALDAYSRLRPAYRNATYHQRWQTSQEHVRLRHSGHSRFPHLDGVVNRLGRVRTTTTTTTMSPLWRRYYQKRKKEDYSENYEDLDYNDDELDKDDDSTPDYDSWENEETKNDYTEDVDDDNDDDDLMQAEEATPEPSTLTQYKWNYYGTRARVEESRRTQMHQQVSMGDDEVRLTIDHIRRMNLEGKCSVPRPKIIDIQSEHPSPGKRYLPHCTVLYRCSEDTGCCVSPDTKCQPKKQMLVHLYFYTNTLGHPRNKIERLSFHNHTECGCSKIGATPVDVEPPPENLRSTRSGYGSRTTTNSLYGGANSISCDCPEVFVAKRRYDGKCGCDCSPSNADCINMKRGKEHFSLKDRKCIIEEKCGVPSCEYGAYLKTKGRCPRKQEKLDAYASVATTSRITN